MTRPAIVYGAPITRPLVHLSRAIADTTARHPDQEALVACQESDGSQARRWTYAQLEADVDILARGLVRQGLGPGGRLAVGVGNQSEYVMLLMASSRIGAALVSLDPAYLDPASVDDLRHALSISQTSLLIVDLAKVPDGVGGLERIEALLPAAVQRCYAIGGQAGSESKRWQPYQELLEDTRGDVEMPDTTALDPESPAVMLFTSGTTSKAKCCPQSSINLVASGNSIATLRKLEPGQVMGLHLPTFHSFSVICIVGCLLSGASMVIPSKRFNAAATLDALVSEKVRLNGSLSLHRPC